MQPILTNHCLGFDICPNTKPVFADISISHAKCTLDLVFNTSLQIDTVYPSSITAEGARTDDVLLCDYVTYPSCRFSRACVHSHAVTYPNVEFGSTIPMAAGVCVWGGAHQHQPKFEIPTKS